MSLKDWMKKVESIQLSENITPQAATTKPGMNSTAAQQTPQTAAKMTQSLSKLGMNQNSQGVVKALTQPQGTSNSGQNAAVAGLAKGIGLDKALADPNAISKIAPILKGVNDQAAAQNAQAAGTTQPVQEGGGSSMRPPTQRSAAFEEIISNHPHEHKMCQEGWGMDNSLYEALCDHYFKEGRIPRGIMFEGGQALRSHVEECYAQDTMGNNQDMINNGMLDEDDYDLDEAIRVNPGQPHDSLDTLRAPVTHVDSPGTITPARLDAADREAKMRDPSVLDRAKSAVGKFVSKLGGPDYEQLKTRPPRPLDEEMSDLERMLTQETTEENTMYESKKTRSVAEATEKTKTGLKHKADAGGYGRKDDEEDTDDDGKKIKKVAKDEPKKGRGRPKKTDNASGEDKKFDFSALSKTSGSKAPKSDKWDKKKTTTHKIATKADREEIDEGRGLAEGSLNEGQYEMMMRNGQVKKFIAKDDADAKRIAAGHGAKSVIKLRGGVPAGKIAEQGLAEGETIEKKGGRIHKGSYGTSHEAGDEGVKKVATQRGRGRPKKDADDSGEVKNYDWSAFGAKKGVKLPAWDKKKTTSHKIATKADREEVDEGAEDRGQNRLWAQITDYEKRAKATKNDTKKAHYMRMASELRGKLKTSDDQKVDEAKLKGGQNKLDINKNGKLDKADFSMLGNQKKKKDAQMESWDRQLKGLLTEGITVSTSVGQEGGQDSVSITASDHDAHQLLQMLQNAGMGTGMPAHAIQAATAPSTVLPKASPSTVGSIANTDGAPNAGAQKDINGGGNSVPIMAMPRGMLLSVNGEEEMPTEPGEFGTLDQEEVVSSLGSEQGNADDNGDGALAAIKKLMSAHGASEVDASKTTPPESKAPISTETEYEVDESDEDGKKPDFLDLDKDGDKKEPMKQAAKKDDSEEESESDAEDDEEEDNDEEEVKEGFDFADATANEIEKNKEGKKVREGKDTCNECGGLMEDDHECGQLNEWSNSPQDQSKDEQFESDMKFMQEVITAGLNGRKSTGQATTPVLASQTNRQMSEGYNIDVAAEMRKLAGIR